VAAVLRHQLLVLPQQLPPQLQFGLDLPISSAGLFGRRGQHCTQFGHVVEQDDLLPQIGPEHLFDFFPLVQHHAITITKMRLNSH
jgi:hypothetical protein